MIGFLMAGLLLVVLLGGVLWRGKSRESLDEPPDIDSSATSPAVARAIKDARKRVLVQPRSAEAGGRLGMLLLAHEFDEQANTCLDRAAELAPQEFRWPYLLGLHQSVSNLDAAARHWRRAAELRPDDVVVRLRLGELFLQQENLEEAAVHLSTAARLAPQHPRASLDMARLSLAQGNLEQSLEFAVAAVQQAPDCGEVHRLLAQLYQQSGQRDAALQELEQAERMRADLGWNDAVAAEVISLRVDTRSIIEMAEAWLRQNQFQPAISLLEATIADDDRHPQVYAVLGRALVQARQLSRAAEILARAVQRHPESAEVWFQLGVVQFSLEQISDAETAFRKALELKPDYALAHYNLAHVRERNGDPDGAASAFEAAIRVRPDYAPAHAHLGRLLLLRGRRETALVHLHRADELEPGNALVQRLLKEAAEKP
jgi:tetratricopeptide (TPR) repeat protein